MMMMMILFGNIKFNIILSKPELLSEYQAIKRKSLKIME